MSKTGDQILARSDSKNPAETCRGITGNGRHCRRALAVAATGIRSEGNGDGPEYYCYLHKDQAHGTGPVMDGQIVQGVNGKRKEDVLREKSSIETLVQKLGITSLEKRKTKGSGKWEEATMEESQGFLPRRRKETPSAQKRKQKKKPSFWASLCCGAGSSQEPDDYVEIIRHRKRLDAQQQAQTRPSPQANKPIIRPVVDHKTDSNTATNALLSLLPSHLPPETTSSLLSELVKPISTADEEGYIYIYWLTTHTPDEGTKRNLLAPPGKGTAARRVSDVLSEEHATRPGTIMLKIGRANNVARRMKEWERQCGFKLNLLRWYPHVPSASTPSSPVSPGKDGSSEGRKVPNVKRVERLIHLELAGMQVKRQCGSCGKEHREWFEVEATREGVRGVDGVVRRWVGWAEGV